MATEHPSTQSAQAASAESLTRRDDELLRLAMQIADGEPLVLAPLERDGHSATATSLLRLDRVVRRFRSALQMPDPEAVPVLFLFAGLEVREQIGAGSYGDVYRAYDPVLRQDVALKLRKPDSSVPGETFLAEARSLAQLRHPNVLSVYGAAIENGRAGLWCELVRGTSLRDLVAAQGALSVQEVLSIGRELCQALACIHRHGWTHGDIKPENIMRDDAGRVVLMDFGSARAAGRDNPAVLRASLRYLAPELLRGAPPDARSDIYALGVTLFHLLTGAFPNGEAPEDPHASAPLRSRLRGVPAPLRKAIEKAIAPDPRGRQSSALAFAAMLDAPVSSRHRTVAVMAALLACAVVALVWQRTSMPPSWTSDAAFYAATESGYRPLRNGDGIRLGDALALQFSTSRTVYLYVVDDDGSPQPSVLFPSDRLGVTNPVAAQDALRLPGKLADGNVTDWQVNRDAAKDRFVVFASAQPLPALETALAGWREAARQDSMQGSLRGAQALVPARATGRLETPDALQHLIDELQTAKARGDARSWDFTFPHVDRPVAN